MHDVISIVKNIESIYKSNTSFSVLKDFERVLDHIELYVYRNWEDGELVEGPIINRHWVTCSFMWDFNKMPDPCGGERLLEYNCKVSFSKSRFIKPKKIKTPKDIRPGTKKGKLEHIPVWIVTIQMPITLMSDMYQQYKEKIEIEDIYQNDIDQSNNTPQSEEPAMPEGAPA